MEKRTTESKHSRRSVERLTHFNCGHCEKWFSIGDAPRGRSAYYCPWCGKQSNFEDDTPKEEIIQESVV